MLLLLVSIVILLGVNYGWGILLKNILNIKTPSFSLVSFLGIIGITFCYTILAFFSALDFVTECIFLTVGLLGILLSLKIRKTQFINFSWLYNKTFYIFLVILLFIGSFLPYLFDHYSYYLPTINYLSEKGFVKGISNLDLLLGQTSLWHIYQAGFSHIADTSLRVNVYLLVLLLIYTYEKKSWALLICLAFLSLFAQQPSPDLPVAVLTLVVMNEWLNNRNNTILLYIAMFAFCIKPIVFWLVLFLIFDKYYKKTFNLKLIIPIAIFGGLLVFKNMWLFGFPIFPLSLFDFNLPWQPSSEILIYSSQMGQLKSYDMNYSYEQVLGFSFWQRIIYWFMIGYKSVLNLAVLFCLAFFAWLAYKKENKIYKVLFVLILLKFVLVLPTSAQYRFLIEIFFLTIFLIFKNITEKKAVVISTMFMLIVSCGFAFSIVPYSHDSEIKKQTGVHISQWIYPARLNQKKPKTYQLGNLKFFGVSHVTYRANHPTISLSWLKIYQYYQIFPQIKNDGFIQKKLTPQENIQLQNIISDLEKTKP